MDNYELQSDESFNCQNYIDLVKKYSKQINNNLLCTMGFHSYINKSFGCIIWNINYKKCKHCGKEKETE